MIVMWQAKVYRAELWDIPDSKSWDEVFDEVYGEGGLAHTAEFDAYMTKYPST